VGVRVDPLVSRARANDSAGSAAPIVLETMRRSDLDAVVDLERRVFAQPWSEELFLRELRIPASRIILARSLEAGAPPLVGYVCRWIDTEVIEIHNVAVDPGWRRRSVGRSLVEQVLVEARCARVERVLLEVRRHNLPAIRLYRSLGFLQTGVRSRYYADGEDALLMEARIALGER
jgi:ribosomal-protein-alanine N-acetyltransferase